MPISEYYKGSGEKVMKGMKKTYKSEKKAKEVFYATANKYGFKPGSKSNREARKKHVQRMGSHS